MDRAACPRFALNTTPRATANKSRPIGKRALRFQSQCFALEPKTPEHVKKGDIPVGVDLTYLEYYVRYHAAHDRAYQRASAELQKRKKARQLAEIGFASQKRAEAEESRKSEKHAVAKSSFFRRDGPRHRRHNCRAV